MDIEVIVIEKLMEAKGISYETARMIYRQAMAKHRLPSGCRATRKYKLPKYI